MDAPKGRYSVLEKDGRLIVVDNDTGAPVSPSPTAPGMRPGAPPVIAPARSAFDTAGALLVALAAAERDEEGRAVIAWKWQENGKPRRWDARLDAAAQRRLGRSLLSIAAAPAVFLLLLLVAGFAIIPFAAMVAASFAVRGWWGLRRLQRDVGGRS